MFFRSTVLFVILISQLFSQTIFQPSNVSQKPVFQFKAQSSSDDSLVNLIVEFIEPPLFLVQKNNLAIHSSIVYEDRFEQFEHDLQGIESQKMYKGQSAKVNAGKKFNKIFFGQSVQTPKSMIPMIEQLSYVKKVHIDYEVKAFLSKSTSQIRANEVWNTYGVKGEGVVVGIIDSGIDYLHPALGGGIGPSFKVIGGYDFVNQDSDPMDDHGHGTHVAGIVGADGPEIQGVAPKVKLFGLKVLGSNGRGSQSNIIAAIERTVDPNQDGDMSDKLDIVNMSLGSYYGDSDDAGCSAVDNATFLGVTFVIAAGNDGNAEIIQGKENNYYFTGLESIGSPGSARSAITVGAIDSVNKMAYFSSKGPTRLYYDIKPDVSAPGVNINSLAIENSYSIKSGTSMASPMVAGVAALMKSKNKNLTPEQIKSAIVNSSVDMGFKKVLQGAGRIDAMRAISNTSFAMPTHLSYGLDNPAQTTWTKIETVTVSNKGVSVQNYSVGFSSTVAGITLSSQPQNFSLVSGESKNILITITVNNTIIPIVDEDIILYEGFAHINGNSDTLHLPWSFARTSRMILTFSESDPQLVGAASNFYITGVYNKYSKSRWLDSKTLEVSGAFLDSYDFAVFFRNSSKLVLKTNLQFTGSESYLINASDAIHPVNFNGVDQNGIPFPLSKTKRSLRVNFSNGFLFAPLNDGNKTILVSPASASFSFQGVEAFIDLYGEKRLVLPQYALFSGINGEVNLTNTSNAYYKQTLQFRVPDNVKSTRIFSDVITTQLSDGQTYYNTIIVGTDTLNVTNNKVEFDLYMMKSVDATFGSSVSFHTNSSYATDYLLDMSTRYFSIINDSVLLGFPSQNWITAYKSPSGDTLRFGESPIHILNLSYNNSFGPSIHFNPLFFGSLFEARYDNLTSGKYSIYNDAGEKLKEDKLDISRSAFPADPGKYRIEIEAQGNYVSNAKGKITLINKFDLSQPIPDPPIITSLRMLNAKKRPANSFVKNEQSELRFSSKIFAVADQVPINDSTKVYYRKYKSSPWMPLLVAFIKSDADKEGAIYSASLLPATAFDSVAVDLKIRLVDATGNSTEQILSPAFTVGNWVDDGTTPVENEPLLPKIFALHQNYPNPFNPATTINFDVPQTDFVNLVVYDILGREVRTLVHEIRQGGKYSLQFNGSNLATGVYLLRLSVGQNTALRKMMLLK